MVQRKHIQKPKLQTKDSTNATPGQIVTESSYYTNSRKKGGEELNLPCRWSCGQQLFWTKSSLCPPSSWTCVSCAQVLSPFPLSYCWSIIVQKKTITLLYRWLIIRCSKVTTMLGIISVTRGRLILKTPRSKKHMYIYWRIEVLSYSALWSFF